MKMNKMGAGILGLLCLFGFWVEIAAASANELLSSDNRGKLAFAIKALKNSYYTTVEEKTIVENMLSGMLTKLDPHSLYLTKDEMHDFESETMGQFGGIGIEIMQDKGLILIVTPLDDTPAARAGIKAGDKIIQINDALVHNLSTQKAVKMMRGEPGTKVKLVISPKDGGGPVVKELIRETIKIKSVRYRMLEPGYGYIRVTFFQANTGKELRKAIAELIKQARSDDKDRLPSEEESKPSLTEKVADRLRGLMGKNKKLNKDQLQKETNKLESESDGEDRGDKDAKELKRPKPTELQGIVLDLRNNPGGLLDTGIQVADAFLDASKMEENKRIVYTESRTSDSKFVAHATVGDLLLGKPLVVLINEGSASASEIVAGALQDHHRAVVVGKRSFGKGSVQTLFPMSDGSGLKITTAVYYTPGGTSLQAKGVEPDIEAEDITIDPKTARKDKSALNISESSLADHIEINKKSDEENRSLREPEPTGEELLYKDYPLYEALQVLKAGSAFAGSKPKLALPTEGSSRDKGEAKAIVPNKDGSKDAAQPKADPSSDKDKKKMDEMQALPERLNSPGALAPFLESDGGDMGQLNGINFHDLPAIFEEQDKLDLESIN